MKIGLVTEFFPSSERAELRGGVESRAFHLAKRLAIKHEVVVLASRERGTPERDEFLGFEVLRFGKEREYAQRWALTARLSFIIGGRRAKGEFDLVDGYNFTSYPVAWGIAKKLGVPAIATYHDVWLGKWVKNIGAGGIFGEILERYVLSRDWGKFITVSGYTRDGLLRSGIRGDRIEVIPSGVDLQMFGPIETEKCPEPTVCCIARLVDYKRVGDLIRALELVRAEIPGVRCKVIGSGPEEGKLKALVGELGLQENVEFLGFIEEHRKVIEILKSSHAFCLPSTVEGLGLVVVEAMAAGVPFVVSELPALVETTGGKGGLFFKPLDHRDLADKLSLVLKDKKIQHALAKEGTREAEKYDWGKLVKRIERTYHEVVAG